MYVDVCTVLYIHVRVHVQYHGGNGRVVAQLCVALLQGLCVGGRGTGSVPRTTL